jgi:GDP-4-dehydro-6-deoxy-D-mannose reductase
VKRILITGASGFVGRHLIERLGGGARDKRGTAARTEIFGTCFPERPEHCEALGADAPDVKLFHVDLRSEESVAALVRDVRPDEIYHLAALSQVRASWEKRREAVETNLMGTFHLFEAARNLAPSARILFVSSSDVYGDAKPRTRKRLFFEEDRDGVVSPYAFTKIAGELLGEFYARREKLAVVVARPFPHTGPGQTEVFVCSDWARQIARIERGEAEPVIRVGNVRIRRDYLDVRDVVRAYALLMRRGKAGEVYNVASGGAPALGDILRTLLSFTERKIVVRVDAARMRKSDIPYLAGSNAKIKARTGWSPRIPLERTLRDLLNYWRGKEAIASSLRSSQ